MKSQRRHELQTNVLGTELGKVLTFIKQKGNIIFWVLMIAILAVLVVVYVNRQSKQKVSSYQSQYDQLYDNPTVKPDDRLRGMKSLSDQEDNKVVSALA